MSFTQRQVVATYLLLDQTPATGTVTAQLSVDMSDGVSTVPVREIVAVLDGSGTATWSLPANDDSTTQPVGTYYTFIEKIDGSSLNTRRR